jgi:hypothetical protein
MKQFSLVIVCLLSFSIGTLAQTSDTFDIATFQPPGSIVRPAANVLSNSQDNSDLLYKEKSL